MGINFPKLYFLNKSNCLLGLMKYLDIETGEVVATYPWTSTTLKEIIKNHPSRFHKLFEE